MAEENQGATTDENTLESQSNQQDGDEDVKKNLPPEGGEDTDGKGAEGEETKSEKTKGEETGKSGQDEVPETYADFTMPEGMEVDTQLLEQAVPVFKELGLTQEQAQKLVDLQAQYVKAGEERQIEAYDQMMGGWWEDTLADKEVGGDKLEESLGLMRKAADVGPPEFRQLMDDYGLSKNQHFIRFMVKMGKYMSEDVPGSSMTPAERPGDRVSRMYPSS